MKNLKKKINELTSEEKRQIGESQSYKYMPNLGLILIDEQVWWECEDPGEGKRFLDSLGLKETS